MFYGLFANMISMPKIVRFRIFKLPFCEYTSFCVKTGTDMAGFKNSRIPRDAIYHNFCLKHGFYNRNKIWKIKNLKISVILEADVN